MGDLTCVVFSQMENYWQLDVKMYGVRDGCNNTVGYCIRESIEYIERMRVNWLVVVRMELY